MSKNNGVMKGITAAKYFFKPTPATRAFDRIIGDGVVSADTLRLYTYLERMGIRSPFMVRGVDEIADTVIQGMTPAKYFFAKSAPTPKRISLLKLKKCSDLHYAIASNREVLAYGFIQDGNVQATYRKGTYGEITLYSDKGRMLTDKEVWYLTENYSSFRNMVEED